MHMSQHLADFVGLIACIFECDDREILFTKWAQLHEACDDKMVAHLY